MKQFIVCFLAVLCCGNVWGQRMTDRLDRGLVVIPTGSTSGSTSNVITWRRMAEEYYGVTYNLYKDGALLASSLTAPCYADNSNGLPTTRYSVAAVKNGVVGSQCTAVTAWSQYVYKNVERCSSGFIDIPLAKVYDRNGSDVTDNYEPNDAEFADLDGDSQLEMIIKRVNNYDSWNGTEMYAYSSTQFDVFDAYDINWQTGTATLLWRIDVGPNMVTMNRTELNIIAYDWDEDGKAEVALRGADNMIIYGPDGRTQVCTIGNMSVNTRNSLNSHSDAQYAWTITGAEYLIYMNGLTGQTYQVIDYPLKRLEANESSLNAAWGDGYGHRCTKHFMGAPVLDGRKASLFVARGIYTRHKMAAYSIDPSTHTLTQQWYWSNNGGSNDPWYGNGNHNFCIADVDEDGRDEIVYGSMVIDDNGRGLSTTGLGHGDALHCSDFDPFRPGLEIFACNEDKPNMNYRNATTSQLYVRRTGSADDGRALCANFSDLYPGAMGRSVNTGMISCVADCDNGLGGNEYIDYGDLNFRIFWDGDLLSEILNSPGTGREAKIEKPGKGRLFTSSGCNMNNDSKNVPCFQGDLIGDWREEIVVRCGQNVRVYTSGYYTNYDIPTLWHDHQYRQAMVWQMHAYNQPPHLSYFLGATEDITIAPPPLTLTDRTIVEPGQSLTTSLNNKEVLTYGYANQTYSLSSSISPRVLTMNVPVWTQGNNNNANITTTTYIHTLNISGSGNLSGAARLVKQGLGTLTITGSPTLSFTGKTDIWGGTVNFNGRLNNSPVWMNRHTTLNSTGGTFNRGLEMCYGATLNVGGPVAQTLSTVTVGGTLKLNYGSRVVLDINSTDASLNDQLNINALTIGTKNWQYGPQYQQPVFYINTTRTLLEGRYPIGTIGNSPANLSDILIESNGNVTSSAYLEVSSGILYLVIPEGAVPTTEAPIFAISSMNSYGTHYYLPSVSYSSATEGATFTGRFIDINGSETVLGQQLYAQDFAAANTDGWSTSTGGRYTPSILYDGTNPYLSVSQGERQNNGCTVTGTNLQDVAPAGSDFNLSFNLKLSSSTNQQPTSFTIYDQANLHPILSLTATGTWSTSWIVNGSSLQVELPNSNKGNSTQSIADVTWCTYQLERIGEHTFLTITHRESGTIILSRTEIQTLSTSGGLGSMTFVTSRYFANFAIDDLLVQTPFGNPFTFNRPGTLEITASAAGCTPTVTTFPILAPYAIYYESPAYNEINAADAASVLGTNLWNTNTYQSRWANWNRNNTYDIVESKNNSGYVDQDSIITVSRKGNAYPLCLIQGYGIGQNGSNATTITASALGDDQTIVYYKADNSWGNGTSYDQGYRYLSADGTFTYTMTNNTFCKLIAYVPIHEEYDETSTTAPITCGAGNIAMTRTFSSITSGSGWNTLVLPFDMNEAQVVRTFGAGTQVARLTGSTSGTLIFSTDTRTVTANEPFLIRVTKQPDDHFYVIAGIDRQPVAEPKVETTYYDFIGSYANSGKVTFPSNTYFYNASNGNTLNKVAENNSITFKAYRAYFSAKNGSTLAKTISISFDEIPTGINEITSSPAQTTIYDLTGRRLSTFDAEHSTLPKGIYIINGKKVLVR
ncbi:MAG: hypothetical protein Q4E32_08740 [Bacteroidales bacterium]|nr:hypothetical protein [Bacteroidales bacterium]